MGEPATREKPPEAGPGWKEGMAHGATGTLQPLPLRFPGTHPKDIIEGWQPEYATGLGAAFAGDSLKLLATLPPRSVALVVTSPPYALHFKKEYGNVDKRDYVS